MNDEETFDGQWCFDSESGEEVLIDTKNNKIVMRRNRSGEIIIQNK